MIIFKKIFGCCIKTIIIMSIPLISRVHIVHAIDFTNNNNNIYYKNKDKYVITIAIAIEIIVIIA